MSVKNLVLIYCATLALGVGSAAHAALFFNEQFNYPNGDLTVYDGTGDNVSGGAWAPYSGTANLPSIEVVNGQARVLQPGSEDAERVAGDTMAAGETWYYAAQVTVNDQRATPATTAIQQEYFLLMKDNTASNLRSRLYVNNPSTGTGGAGYRLAIGPSSGTANAVNWTSDLSFGQEYTVVVSYQFDTGFASLWVNPANQASPSVTAMLSPSPMTAISAVGLRQAFFGGGAPNTEILVDALTFADSFDEALTALAIPEPATLGLAGFVALAMVAAGRRRG
jgi:hypothetical protein